jgi:hypothetical protein
MMSYFSSEVEVILNWAILFGGDALRKALLNYAQL